MEAAAGTRHSPASERASPLWWGALGAATLGAFAWLRRARRLDLRGKAVLITGGSRGLGLVLARRFLSAGAKVAVCARDSAELSRAEADLLRSGPDVLALPCDLRSDREIRGLVREVESTFGALDILVNNAGVIQVGPFDALTHEDWQEAFDLHFWAPLHATYAALPGMRARGGGRIVNISSIGGKVSVPHLLPYCASKFALVGLSEGLRAELAPMGIRVTTVCPGLMRTGSVGHAFFKGRHREEHAWFALSASAPLLSMAAETAARRIVRAVQHGDAEVILSLPAQLAARFAGLFPGTTADLAALVNRWVLPEPGGIGTERASGTASASSLAPSFFTTLNDRAAARNNQLR